MTIRKLWLLLLMFTAVIAITINTLLLSILTDRYFKDYVEENYRIHFDQIVGYSKKVLTQEELSHGRIDMEMQTHLIDPIVKIRLYDNDGDIIADVEAESYSNEHGMMNNMMNARFDASLFATDRVELREDNVSIGCLDITRYGSVTGSAVAREFKSNIFIDSIYSTLIVLLIAFLIGIYVSKKMSRDLVSTAKTALEIDLGGKAQPLKTKIQEIDTIQKSLNALSMRLRLKNRKRKVLIDEIMHQARTPLTILKTHLEGFSDNIIEVTPEELRVCDDQINNITSIISNMGRMLDAEHEHKKVVCEKFDAGIVLKQIVDGLKPQFAKKKIALKLKVDKNVALDSDRYMFSQIIYNILMNAYRYTGEDGTVKIECEEYNDFVSVRIEDDGQGIAEEDIDRIFEAYYRGGQSNATSGEGLGLYFVKENLKELGGEIKVSSRPGQGSSFTVTFPRNQQCTMDVL